MVVLYIIYIKFYFHLATPRKKKGPPTWWAGEHDKKLSSPITVTALVSVVQGTRHSDYL